jgi:hypothetical protein
MDSENHQMWFPTQKTQFTPLDSVLTADSLHSGDFILPNITEEPWEFDWFTDSDTLACLEQSSQDVTESKPSEAVSTQVIQDFVKQIQQIRQEMSDLHDICIEKLDALEKTVTIHERYVSSLVPWSMDVHKKYSELLKVAQRQEQETVHETQASAKFTKT